jgi:hypothetical protein
MWPKPAPYKQQAKSDLASFTGNLPPITFRLLLSLPGLLAQLPPL